MAHEELDSGSITILAITNIVIMTSAAFLLFTLLRSPELAARSPEAYKIWWFANGVMAMFAAAGSAWIVGETKEREGRPSVYAFLLAVWLFIASGSFANATWLVLK